MISRRYEILGEIGQGAMGVVYHVLDRLTGNTVALKKVMPSEVQLGDGDLSTKHPDKGSTTAGSGDSAASASGAIALLPRSPGDTTVPDITDVTLASGGSPGSTSDSRLALAREFRLLSSLSHPNIIRVLDYGFEDRRLPFYTMDRLEGSRTVLQAGTGQPLGVQVGLLTQMLQALAYLHRRGIIHRDIKPSNALVDGDRVKLVDFGISELREQAMDSEGITGTIAYMAPELLQGKKASEASDLFAVGVVAFEMITGRHPFKAKNLTLLMVAITKGEPPDCTGLDPRLHPLFLKLLRREIDERYRSAEEVIQDLTSALGLPLPEETAAIRDSFLKSAKLVGRRKEMGQLAEHLAQSIVGLGGVVLIGGESGVGKTRLLDELRTLALVKGAFVIDGQEVRRGNSPYQVWRQPIRYLCLETDIQPEEEEALEILVPDLRQLLDRDSGDIKADLHESANAEAPQAREIGDLADDNDAAKLDPVAAQKRLLATAETLFRRQAQPVVVLLEDLQWSGEESLALLARLQVIAGGLPLLIVGTYRDDEKPDLPEAIPGAEVMKLHRLSPEAIEELGASMLGAVGHRQEVLDLLVRETEGNVFFVVEVARALAEEAGRLDGIDAAHLPQQITTGGIQRILRRRIDRFPLSARPLLEAAAVAGRELDLNLLTLLTEGLGQYPTQLETADPSPAFDLPAWLRTGVAVAVLEVNGEAWRFTHDKLREHLLQDLDGEKRRHLHHRIAEALVQAYGDAPEHLGAQAFHFTEAAAGGEPAVVEKAVRRLNLAGGLAVASCAHRTAVKYLRDGLRLLPSLPASSETLELEMKLQNELGAAYLMSKGHAASEVRTCFERSRSLCQQMGNDHGLLPVLLGLWRHHVVRGELATARELAGTFLELAEQAGDLPFVALADSALGTSLMYQGETAKSWQHFARSIETYDSLPPASRRRAARAFSYGQNPGVANLVYGACDLWCLGYPDQALQKAHQGIDLADQLAHPFSQAFAAVITAWVHQFRRELEPAGEQARLAMAISKAQGFQLFLAVGSVLLGWSMAMQGQGAQGIGMISQTLGLLRASGSELLRPYFLALLAEACGNNGAIDDGLAAVHEAIEIAERSEQGWWLPEIHRLEGELLLMGEQPDSAAAQLCFEKALGMAWQRNEKGLALRAASSLAQARQQNNVADPVRPLEEVFGQFTEGFDTADLKAASLLLSMTS